MVCLLFENLVPFVFVNQGKRFQNMKLATRSRKTKWALNNSNI